jgi:hypothetical protein
VRFVPVGLATYQTSAEATEILDARENCDPATTVSRYPVREIWHLVAFPLNAATAASLWLLKT